MYDCCIRGGTVIDGSGGPEMVADIGIADEKIAAVGKLTEEAALTLDARGKAVTPGFLDIHRHGDLAVFRPGFGELELRQGLTTIVNGNCGMSAAPFGPKYQEGILEYLSPVIGSDTHGPHSTMADYLNAVGKVSLPLHVGTMAGSGVIRADAAGFAAGSLEPDQLRAVHASLEQALSEGALGVSLGLGYAPDCFYDTEGLIEALAPLRNSRIPLAVHMRDEGDNVVQSVQEMLTVAESLRCPLEISHLKAIGRENWRSKIPEVLQILHQARENGLPVRWDAYVYTAGSTQLLHILPPEVLEGGTDALCKKLLDPGCRAYIRQRLETAVDYNNIPKLVGWENILLSSLRQPENQVYIGRSVAEAAAERCQDPADCAMDLLASERCTITMIDYITCEEDIAAILKSEAVSVISDSTYPTAGKPHPRLYGNFVRVIDTYVNQRKLLTLPEAIHKMTASPALAMGLDGKGLLAVGMDADINIFDPNALREVGTFADPSRFPVGMDTVLVSGVPVLLHGVLTGKAPGTVLSR